MRTHTWIDQALLDEVSAAARESPRGRRNRNFHNNDEAKCHRLLNAVEPQSYIRPHRHEHPDKDESILVVRGRLGVIFFDPEGGVLDTALMESSGPTMGVDITHGTFHSLVALEPGTVFFESKAGPYVPLEPNEIAPWAPAEGEQEAGPYQSGLAALFR